MTLRWLDAFDHYTAIGDIGKMYDQGTPTLSGADGVSSVAGRFGNGLNFALGNATPGAASYCGKLVPGLSHATGIVGFAYRFRTPTTFDRQVFAFKEGTTVHVSIRHGSSGVLYFANSAGTLIGNTTPVLSPNVWYYIEAKVVINDTTGSVQFRVNETAVSSVGSLDTRNGGSGLFTAIGVGFAPSVAVTGSIDYDIDDLYVCDGAGSTNNDFLGDTRVQAIFPNGNGNSSQLVGSDGNSTDNYLLVDETAPATADYVESSTAGDKDTYAYGNVTPGSGTVHGVMLVPYAAKTDAGVRSIVSVARSGSTEADGSVKTLSTTTQMHPEVMEAKPGGGAWSISDVNAAEFGAKVNA